MKMPDSPKVSKKLVFMALGATASMMFPLLGASPARAGFLDRVINRAINSVEYGVDRTVDRTVNKAVDCVTGSYCPQKVKSNQNQNQGYPVNTPVQEGYSNTGTGYPNTGAYPNTGQQGGYPQGSTSLTNTETPAPSNVTLIADIDKSFVTLNKGTEGGFSKGQKVSIERVVKPIVDPQTGRTLRVVTNAVGQIQITEVGNGFAVGTIISGKGFKVGDTAKPI
jgi:hypothetical protein